MNQILPSLRQLRHLVAVIETRHFGRAADLCLVTQSTLSASIQELEALLGAVLLERTKRVVVPTALGFEIADRARDLLRRAEDLVDLAQAAQAPLTGRVRLGLIPTIGPYVLPALLPVLRRDYPDLKLYLKEDQTERLLTQLAGGDLDVVLMALPWPLADLTSLVLAQDRFFVAMPRDHRLAGRTTLDARDLQPPSLDLEDLLLLEDGHCLRQHALAACEISAGPQRHFQATSLYTLLQMVANGLGITLVPELAIRSAALAGVELALCPLAGQRASRQIGLVWRQHSAREAEYRLLGDEIKRVALG